MERKFFDKLLQFRLPIILSLNLALAVLGWTLALCLRFDFNFSEVFVPHRFALPISLLLLFRGGAYIFFGLNQGFWRYSSTYELIRILKAHAVSLILLTASILMLRLPDFPRSVIFIDFAISILLSGGSRFFVRLWCERYLAGGSVREGGYVAEVVILGGGDSGHLLVKNFLSKGKLYYKPVAVLDDGERLQRGNVYGVPVCGPISSLAECLERMKKVSAVIVAIPSLSQARFLEIEEICKSFDVQVKRLQSFEDISCQDARSSHAGLSVEAVLEKEVNVQHESEIYHALKGKRILITGAGGSIGRELVRQIIHFSPKSLVMLDNSEFNLYDLQRELSQSSDAIDKHTVLASICNTSRLLRVFSKFKPEYVFHAAAYKHVPLMEENPYEAFHNNVLGTRNLLDISLHLDVQKFVLISTDKAVDPCSLMGCSKRIAEMLVKEARLSQAGTASRMQTAIVRFGNVINSAGSVIPLFKEQILSGGPITVTHPDMERFFMSIREAVRLVLTAGTLGQDGEIYILDMGEPVKVVDVAKKMRALFGRRDVPIKFIGMRPGEKLKETLTCTDEQTTNTDFNKVRRVTRSKMSSENLFQAVSQVEDKLNRLSDYEISTVLMTLVRERQSQEELELAV